MDPDNPYSQYWARKEVMHASLPTFAVQRWWATDGLCDIERIYFEAVREKRTLLDFGAGDLRIRRKLQAAGYHGTYDTLDIGEEYAHTYADISEVRQHYGAILCLDVIEHMVLEKGLALIDSLVAILEPGGVLVLQTPNARCVRSPLASDMTHVQCYNLPDLWAYIRCKGLSATGYRIPFVGPRLTPLGHLRSVIQKIVITKLLGADYADNIGLVARKPADGSNIR